MQLLSFLWFCVVLKYANTLNIATQVQLGLSGIYPDILDVPPSEEVKVTYPGGINVNLGNELHTRDARVPPVLGWRTEPSAYYTILLTDPDGANHFREFRHWLVINIIGNETSNGQTIYDYIGPLPITGSDFHRYVFLVFKQKGFIEYNKFVPNTNFNERIGTSTRDLIRSFDLHNPFAANYFIAQGDEYVPFTLARLAGVPLPLVNLLELTLGQRE